MSRLFELLFGVPRVNQFESPFSWISRLALSQSAKLENILDLFLIDDYQDIDLYFSEKCIERAEVITGISLERFKIVRDIYSITTNLSSNRSDFFLYSDKGNPRYRYCPVCLYESRIKSFDFNWRYDAWRWCPVHDCLMVDKCCHCEEYIELTRSMITAGKDREGVAYLDRCLKCGDKISKKSDEVLHPFKDNLLLEFEKTMLENGRAFLSSIYNKNFYIFRNKKPYAKNNLMSVYMMGIIPSNNFELTNEDLESRLASAINHYSCEEVF